MVQTCSIFRVLQNRLNLLHLRRANNSGSADVSGVRSGDEEVSDACVVEESDKDDCDLDRVMNGAEAKERCF